MRNLAVAATTAIALRLTEEPVVGKLAEMVERRRLGLLQRLRLPSVIETAVALVLMDYTLYVWHVLVHRVPLLWRCHLVHHVDLDLSTTTALRFHFSEMVLSVPWRAAQVLLIGVRRPILKAWQTATLAEILFHHSNFRLSHPLERLIEYLVVTPRMHGIHHSTVREETESNWSSGLTLWDRLHGTLRLDVPQQALTIGTPGYRDPVSLPCRRSWRCRSASSAPPGRRWPIPPRYSPQSGHPRSIA